MTKKPQHKAESEGNGTGLGQLAKVLNEIPSESQPETDLSEGTGGTSEPEPHSEPTSSQTDSTASDSTAESGPETGV